MLRNILVAVCKSDTGYGAYAPDYPGCVATGATPEEAKRHIAEALELHLRGMLEDGEPLPEDNCDFGIVQVVVPSAGRVDGRALRLFRKRRGLTQAELADKLDVTKETISEWERNNREIPGTLRFALELAG